MLQKLRRSGGLLSSALRYRERMGPGEEVEIAIVGGGFGGLGMAAQLRLAGIDDFVLLERSDDVGGTWSANTYPGCQCDIPSNLYSFSFHRKHDWSRSYPEQPEILDYLHGVVERFGLMPHIRLGCELHDAAWDEREARWRIETPAGSLSARVLVIATGLLSEPSTPQIPGLGRFQGTTFHSARWNHAHDLTGERVAVLGTGASATQLVPRIQPHVGRLLVLQRTPPWILPHPDRAIGERTRALYRRLPAAQRLARFGIYWAHEAYVIAFRHFRPLLRVVEAVSRLHMRRQLPDPDLRRRATPDYALFCKRIILSNDWYPALAAPNAELVTEGVEEIRERSLVTRDGREHEVDAIIFGTGFSPTDPPIARRVSGRGGLRLDQLWQKSPRAYLGTTVTGFPNMFLVYGPNTNLGHNSIVYMIEVQVDYILGALRAMRERNLAAIEVRQEAQDRWNAELQRELAGSIWNTGGCSSWYLDANGGNPTMWPGFTWQFRRRASRFDLADYAVERRAAAPLAV